MGIIYIQRKAWDTVQWGQQRRPDERVPRLPRLSKRKIYGVRSSSPDVVTIAED